LRSVFHVSDVNSPLQAFEWVSIGAEQVLEEANVVRGHHTLPTRSNYREYCGKLLTWIKKATGMSRRN
jgi:hypothetical protein